MSIPPILPSPNSDSDSDDLDELFDMCMASMSPRDLSMAIKLRSMLRKPRRQISNEANCVNAAQSFEHIDPQCLRARDSVKQAVMEGNLEDAIQKVREFCPQLLDAEPQLLFHLQQQWLIELIQKGKTEEAVELSRKLAPIAGEDPGLLEELEKTMVLLVFEDAKRSPPAVAELLYPSQRLKIANELNAAMLNYQSKG